MSATGWLPSTECSSGQDEPPSSEQSYLKPLTGAPAGVVTRIRAPPFRISTVGFPGAGGAPNGVVTPAAFSQPPGPLLRTAATSHVYSVPLSRPLMVVDVSVDVPSVDSIQSPPAVGR